VQASSSGVCSPPVDFSLSVVVPAYNEQEVLAEFHRRLAAVLDKLPARSEIVYVNDGSRDGTLLLMQRMRAEDPRVSIVDLSRNYGKEIALTAGLDHACGDAVVVIDADLQDPPELIPTLIGEWRAGHDVVFAQRTARDGESLIKKVTAAAFYRVIQSVSRVPIPPDTGDFRLLSRRAVDALAQLREHHRFMKGLFAWIGFPQKAVPYRRDARFGGNTKWNYWQLWNFAIEGITSFSIAPLKVATYSGMLIGLLSFAYALFIIYKTIAHGEPVRGYPSLMVVVLFLGGVQLLFIGVMGEYLGRLFNEAKRRPLYFTNVYQRSATIAPGRTATDRLPNAPSKEEAPGGDPPHDHGRSQYVNE
jgi:glycosyltransferase involved in cell wall biosynthesis